MPQFAERPLGLSTRKLVILRRIWRECVCLRLFVPELIGFPVTPASFSPSYSAVTNEITSP